MKAAVVAAPGRSPEFAEFAEPVVDADQQLVELVAAGIHPLVRSLASGQHYGSGGSWPLIPGVDAVARTADGTAIYTGYVRAPYGTMAERMAVPAGLGMALPAGADPAQVAAGLNPGLSSWLPLRARVDETGALGTVLVLGVTGMAGALAVQNALALGASRVIGVGRNPAGLQHARDLGAVTLPLTGDRTADAAALLGALDGAVPGLVLDFVWGSVAETAFEVLGRHGLQEDTADVAYVEIGAMAGADARVPGALLRSRRIRLVGSGAGSTPVAHLMREIPRYLQLIADGRVVVPVRTFALSDVAAAWSAAAAGGPRPVLVSG